MPRPGSTRRRFARKRSLARPDHAERCQRHGDLKWWEDLLFGFSRITKKAEDDILNVIRERADA